MNVTEVSFVPIEGATQKSLMGIANITLDGVLVINGIRLIKGKYGPFLGFPSKKGTDGEYHDIVFPLDKDLRGIMLAAVLAEMGDVDSESKPSSDQDSEFF